MESYTGSVKPKSPLILDFQEQDLKRYFSPSPLRFSNISIGGHPDFLNLGDNETTNHFTASLFMDIKGSTRLIEIVKSLEELRRVKDTILTIAIKVCNFFGGHVQRLQGDGIFVLFTRKNQEPFDAVIGALNASSVLTYFIKTEFAPELRNLGIEKSIRIRTGIDYGGSNQVLWSRYGIPGCDELTTTSVHTDMAAKLQQRAPSNGILIGDNVRKLIDLDQKFLSHKTFREDGILKEDKEIIVSQRFKYPFWVFDWEKFLLTYSCCEKDGSELVFKKPEKRLKCTRLDTGYEYFENSYALPKSIKVKFDVLNRHGGLLVNYPPKKISWKIVNTGNEATEKENLDILVSHQGNLTSVTVDTAYLGHHKMRCEIRDGFKLEILEFHVFVMPDKLLTQ